MENQNEINRSQSINNSPRTPNTPNRATVPYTQINQTLRTSYFLHRKKMTLDLFVLELSDVFLLLFLGIYFSEEFHRFIRRIILGLCVVNMRTSIDITDMPKNSLASSEGMSHYQNK